MNHAEAVKSIPLQKSYETLKLLPITKKTIWRKLAVTLQDETRFISFEDIVYCKSTSNYTTIFTHDNKSYLCCKTLKEIASKLPEELFIRIHHSYVVNIHFITAVKKQKSEMEIDNRIMLPVSQSRKAGIYKLLHV